MKEVTYYFYDVYGYDVWGDKTDGFSVNDCYPIASDIVLAEEVVFDEQKLIEALKDLGIIRKGLHTKSIEIEGEPDFTLYFADTRRVSGYKPEFELRCTKIV